jgi:hypothetical protein
MVLALAACGGDDDTDAGTSDSASGGDGSPSGTVAEVEASDTGGDDDGGRVDAAAHDDQGEDHADGHDDEDTHDHDDEDTHDHDDEGASGGLGAHEHGVAELSVAWSETEVFVDLVSPTYNIFGFEHEPSTDDERSVVTERTDALIAPGVIVINEEAGCELAGEVVTDVELEGSHAELTASWLFACEHPDDIKQLDVASLFDEFPNLEDIDAQWVSPSGQSAAELSPSATVLGLG